eukprot:6524954-Prymnesium_polylepis.4
MSRSFLRKADPGRGYREVALVKRLGGRRQTHETLRRARLFLSPSRCTRVSVELRRNEHVLLHLARADLELCALSGSHLDPKSSARDEDQRTAGRASRLEVSGCWEDNAAAHHVVGSEPEERAVDGRAERDGAIIKLELLQRKRRARGCPGVVEPSVAYRLRAVDPAPRPLRITYLQNCVRNRAAVAERAHAAHLSGVAFSGLSGQRGGPAHYPQLNLRVQLTKLCVGRDPGLPL